MAKASSSNRKKPVVGYTVDDMPFGEKKCPHCGVVAEKRWNLLRAVVRCENCKEDIRIYHESELV
jgi:uncharacterized protein (DUF983 family)